MSEVSERRRGALADLIRSGAPGSQDELAGRLADLGFAVTQATISRDLELLGATKVRRDGRLTYALLDPPQATGGSRLSSVLRDWVRSIAPAGNLVVVKTPPGSAHLVGVALDEAGIQEIVGTICGDDTIFAATESPTKAGSLVARLEAMRSGQA